MDIRLLGPLQVLDATGVERPIGGDRPRAIVTLLALEAPTWVSVDRMVDSIWGDAIADPEAALHVAMSRLRKTLGESIIVTGSGGYRLDLQPENLDLGRFRRQSRLGRQLLTLGNYSQASEAFRQALAQFRGPPLDGLDSFLFAADAARLLDAERLSVVERLMEVELAAGNHDLVAGELGGLVSRYPLRERLWEHLMVALYRAGRQADALRAYARLKETLGDELGIEPSPALAELEERILLHDPWLEESAEAATAPGHATPQLLSFGAGDVIVEQGSHGDHIYWVETGLVEVFGTGDEGGEVVLARLGPGRYFGELAPLLGTPRTASVRAVETTTLAVHTIDSLRQRLGVERGERAIGSDRRSEVWDLIRVGEYLRAYDLASLLIERSRSEPELQYLAVLALAKAGAIEVAVSRYQSYGLSSVDPATISVRLAGDIAALAARLDKDIALADAGRRVETARRSARGYHDAFVEHRSPYLSVNAATMWLLAGDSDRAEASARSTLMILDGARDTSSTSYWDAASEAEAALILGDVERAGDALARAGELSLSDPSARATTTRQLQMVCSLLGADDRILTPILNQPVLHYCGHRIGSPGTGARFPAGDANRVSSEIERVVDDIAPGAAFGSLAAGADILVVERLLLKGVDVHVYLPSDRDVFVAESVAPAGESWVGRFESCLARAQTVTTSVTGGQLEDPTLFDFNARLAMGDAVMRAGFLETEARQLAIWDGFDTDEVAGTAVDVMRWRASGRTTTVIPISGEAPGTGVPLPPIRTLATVVFGDFAGFSRLTDSQVVVFWEKVMAAMAAKIEEYQPHFLFGNTWGDGIHFVFDDAPSAAECLISLQDLMRRIDFPSLGLSPLRGLRLAAHTAPVFAGWDPVSGKDTFYGAGMSQAARIEPDTPEGEVYVTQPFAALASLSPQLSFGFQYVGTLPSAKGYGTLPLFALKRRPDPIVGPHSGRHPS